MPEKNLYQLLNQTKRSPLIIQRLFNHQLIRKKLFIWEIQKYQKKRLLRNWKRKKNKKKKCKNKKRRKNKRKNLILRIWMQYQQNNNKTQILFMIKRWLYAIYWENHHLLTLLQKEFFANYKNIFLPLNQQLISILGQV